jgi:hypothetical protein
MLGYPLPLFLFSTYSYALIVPWDVPFYSVKQVVGFHVCHIHHLFVLHVPLVPSILLVDPFMVLMSPSLVVSPVALFLSLGFSNLHPNNLQSG